MRGLQLYGGCDAGLCDTCGAILQGDPVGTTAASASTSDHAIRRTTRAAIVGGARGAPLRFALAQLLFKLWTVVVG
eukprot:3064496-Pyramimonas_sp.AAC.1